MFDITVVVQNVVPFLTNSLQVLLMMLLELGVIYGQYLIPARKGVTNIFLDVHGISPVEFASVSFKSWRDLSRVYSTLLKTYSTSSKSLSSDLDDKSTEFLII